MCTKALSLRHDRSPTWVRGPKGRTREWYLRTYESRRPTGVRTLSWFLPGPKVRRSKRNLSQLMDRPEVEKTDDGLPDRRFGRHSFLTVPDCKWPWDPIPTVSRFVFKLSHTSDLLVRLETVSRGRVESRLVHPLFEDENRRDTPLYFTWCVDRGVEKTVDDLPDWGLSGQSPVTTMNRVRSEDPGGSCSCRKTCLCDQTLRGSERLTRHSSE